MTLVPVNPALTLFQIDRIGGEVPVVDDVAIGMEIKAFLSDRCCGKDEWAKWRIEGLANASGADECLTVIIADIAESDCKPAAHRKVFHTNMALRSCFQIIHT